MKTGLNRALLSILVMAGLLTGPDNRGAFAQTRPDTAVVGMWRGVLKFGESKLTVVFHVSRSDSGSLKGTVDSPDQGAMGIPMSSVKSEGDSVFFVVKTIGGNYSGRISADRQSIEGVWRQGGGMLSLSLRRSANEVILVRPQEPKPPYPYKSEEVSYENAAQGVKLAGTLTLPDSGAPFPAVVMITGSGSQNRNEEVFGHKPFLVISDYLTRRGIAVLRVDDRGVGGSTGSPGSSTSADLATDVIAGINFLKNRHDIDAGKIGLIGHSEGGIIAPLVASEDRSVAFIVMLAGTGLPGEEVLPEQSRLIEEADGTPAGKIEKDVSWLKKACSIVTSGKDSASIAVTLGDYLRSTISEWGDDFLKSGMDTTATVNRQVGQFDSRWFRFFLAYDPRPALRKVKCPVLAMGGTLDLQVPAEENLRIIGEALKESGNRDYTLKLLPGLNHLFQDAKTGSPKEYARIEETFSPAALKLMGDWIVDRTLGKPGSGSQK